VGWKKGKPGDHGKFHRLVRLPAGAGVVGVGKRLTGRKKHQGDKTAGG